MNRESNATMRNDSNKSLFFWKWNDKWFTQGILIINLSVKLNADTKWILKSIKVKKKPLSHTNSASDIPSVPRQWRCSLHTRSLKWHPMSILCFAAAKTPPDVSKEDERQLRNRKPVIYVQFHWKVIMLRVRYNFLGPNFNPLMDLIGLFFSFSYSSSHLRLN